MAIDAHLENHWRAAFESKQETPTERAERKMFQGTALAGVVGNPALDPLALDPATFEERRRVREAWEKWEWASTGCDARDHLVRLNSGEWIHPHDLRVRLDRQAYEMLKRGTDERTIAAACHLTIDEVDSIRQRHSLQ